MEALIDVLDRDGSVRQSFAVHRWPVTVGRDLQCDVVLDDPHVAARHAQLGAASAEQAPEGAGVPVLVLQSLNGLHAHGRHWPGGAALALAHGDLWQVGRTRLRLRLAGGALAPEMPLQEQVRWRAWWPVLMLLLLSTWEAGRVYLITAQDGFWGPYLSGVGAAAVAILVWSGLWALAGKLFQHRMMFWQHVTYVAAAVLATQVLNFGLAVLAYASSVELLGRIDVFTDAVLLGALLYAQFRLVQPARPRTAWFLALAFMGVLLLFQVGTRLARGERWTPNLHLSALMPPQLHWSGNASVGEFMDAARALEPELQRKAREPVKGVQDFVADDND